MYADVRCNADNIAFLRTPQVWQQCASIDLKAASVPSPAPRLAPLCGDEAHGCCVQQSAKGGCSMWSAVNTCVLTKEHCENGTVRIGRENKVEGCGGTWMPEVPVSGRCEAENKMDEQQHVCGIRCSGAADATAPAAAKCNAYAALGTRCAASKSGCADGCNGRWLDTGTDTT